MTTFKTRLTTALVLLAGSALPSLADGFTIADVAPKSAAVVVSIEDYKAMRASFDKTGFMEVWQDKGIQEWFRKYSKEAIDKINNDLEELDLKLEDLKEPAGTVGWSMWIDAPTDESKKPTMNLLAFGDWGENAEETAKKISEAMARGEEKKAITVDEDEYAGFKIFAITPIEAPDAPDAEGDEGDDDFGDMGSNEPFEEIKTFFYARIGNILVISSAQSNVERTIDRSTGKDLESISDTSEYAASMAQIGKSQVYGAFFTGPLMALLEGQEKAARAHLSDEEKSFMPPPTHEILGLLGLAGVKAAAGGLRFDTDAGMAEGSIGILVPDKKGLFTLMDPPAASFTAPSFVTADASGITMAQFEFAGLLPLLGELSKQLPPEQGQQIQEGLAQAEGMISPILNNIGPQIYIVQSIEKPLGPDSQQMLVATSVTNADAVAQQINTIGGFVGLQARDFQGNQIWSMPEGGGMPVPGLDQAAIGIGAGHLFIGQSAAVENALRQAGSPDGPTLAKDPRFQKAMKSLPANGLAFLWADTRQSVEFADWMLHNSDKIQAKQADAMFGDDPESQEAKKEYIESLKAAVPEAMRELPSLAVLANHIGDSVGEFQVTPDGLRGRFIYLRPAK